MPAWKSKLQTITKWFDRFQRLCATDPIQRQLFPRLTLPVTFRVYQPRDYEACLLLHDLNEPGRFPPDSRHHLESLLKSATSELIIAQYEDQVIGCGGAFLASENVQIFVYGLVHPDFQGHRIGSTLTLLRLCHQLPHSGWYAVFIFAV